MAERKSFLLRVDGKVLDALKQWADEDMRSLNGHIEFLLRRVLKDSGRLKSTVEAAPSVEREFEKE